MGMRDYFESPEAPEVWEECPLCADYEDSQECIMCEGLKLVPHKHDPESLIH
jgi:hypothetical protein